jgi:hypothetical protein
MFLTRQYVENIEKQRKEGKISADDYEKKVIAVKSKEQVISRFLGHIRDALSGKRTLDKAKRGGGGGGGGGDGGSGPKTKKKKKLSREATKYYLYSLIFKEKIKVCNTK